VLDVGCGRGAFLSDPVETRRDLHVLKGLSRAVIGIDVDPTSEKNQAISEFRLIEGSRWPVGDESIDVCVRDWVLEHVEDPVTFFAECSRRTSADQPQAIEPYPPCANASATTKAKAIPPANVPIRPVRRNLARLGFSRKWARSAQAPRARPADRLGETSYDLFHRFS
jgi:SAM-dependent methyltransferase